MENIILQGDALTKLKELPEKSINMCMTSPPYWALRDYGNGNEQIWGGDENCEHDWEIHKTPPRGGHSHPDRLPKVGANKDEMLKGTSARFGYESNYCNKCGAWKGQLGLEPTFDQYISNLCDIFDEVKKVLRDDGTCWVNLGDTYFGGGNNRGNNSPISEKQASNKGAVGQVQQDWSKMNYESKCLCMIPQRFAIEMVNRGWILRNTIIWHKPNAMPCSVKDRFTVDFEYIFFFSKQKKYYFETQYEPLTGDIDKRGNNRIPYNIKTKNEWHKPSKDAGFLGQNPIGKNKRTVWDIKDRDTPYAIIEPEFRKEIIDFRDLPEHNNIREYLSEWKNKKEITIEQIENHFGNQAGHHWFEKEGSYPSKDDWLKLKELLEFDNTFDECMTTIFQKSGLKQDSEEGKIKRTVWRICPKPFKEAHFAVYPEALCETPIRAGTPYKICPNCKKGLTKEEFENAKIL